MTRLSARQTFYCKVILPVFWLGLFAAMTTVMFVAPERLRPPPPTWMKWQLAAFTLLGAAAFGRFLLPLKRVRMDDEALWVSNYLREVRVPLADVRDVTASAWVSGRPVTVHLWRDCAFGARIVFLPVLHAWRWWGEHPVVDELRAAVARAQGRAPIGR